MSKGNFTALQKLQPIKQDWGEASRILQAEEEQQYNRKKDEEKARQDKRDEIGYDELAPVITGIDSLDKGLTLGIQEASTMQYQDYKTALNDPSYADSPEYKIRTKNLNNYSKNVKAFSDGFSELAQSVIAKSQDSSLSDWDNDLLSTLNGGFVSEKVKFGVANDGSVEAYVASTDRNLVTDENPNGYVLDEDGKMKMTKVTPNEVFKGLGKFSVTPDVDILKKAQDLGTELGKSVDTSVNGYTITTEQTWENKKEDTRKIVRGLLGSPNNPTALAKRLWADEMGEDSRSLTEDNMTAIEDKLLDKIKPFYDQEVKKTVNYSARTQDAKNKADREANNVTPEYVVDTETGAPTIVPLNGKDANIISFGDGKGISVLETESTKESIQNIYIDESGDIYADKVKETKYKGDPVLKQDGSIDWVATEAQKSAKGWEAEKTEKPVKLTPTDFTNLSKNPNMVDENGKRFKDGKALKDFLKRRKQLLPKNQTKSVKTGSGKTYQ